MAELKVVETTFKEFRSFGGGGKEAVSDEFYGTLIDKIDTASKKAQESALPKNEKPISSDKEVSETLEKTIKDVFESEDYGVDFADSYAILDENDKAEFESIILGFINVLEKEIANEDNAGAMQSLLDRLFPKEATFADPYASVRETLLKLQEEGKTDAEGLMEIIIPMLLDASNAEVAEPSYEYGKISVDGKEMSLEDTLKAMQEIAAMITEINAGLAENPEQGLEENPEGEIPGISGEVETPEVPEVNEGGEGTETPEVPEVNEGGEGTETPEVPEVNEGGEGTETPEVPETPEVNETPVEPETPEVSDETETPEEVPAETPAEENEDETVEEEHLESPAEMVDILSRNGFSTTSTGFTRNTTELEEIAVSSISQQNIQNFGNIANFDEATMQSVQRQVITATQEIMGRLTVNSEEDVNLVLNPENLGRISVRLTNQGGDIIIRIAAESEETQAILRDRLPSLMQSLTEINNSVREITVEEISQSAEMQANLMFGNGNQNANSGSEQNSYNGNEAVEEISETAETDSMEGAGRLWQKA